ncbi:MAG: hypothetical protein HY960_11050 [Ignavibacteriae bacterium]|nr:hypothetical protein [Ignavibacteriota bacterium]
MEYTDVVTTVTYLAFLYLIISIFIERIIEVLISFISFIELQSKGFQKFWNDLAESYRIRLDALYGLHGVNEKSKQILDWLLWKVVVEKSNPGGRDCISAEMIRFNYVRICSRIAALLISFLLVTSLWRYLDFLRFFYQFTQSTQFPNGSADIFSRMLKNLIEHEWVRIALTSIALSIGVEPLHDIISRIEKSVTNKLEPVKGGQQ